MNVCALCMVDCTITATHYHCFYSEINFYSFSFLLSFTLSFQHYFDRSSFTCSLLDFCTTILFSFYFSCSIIQKNSISFRIQIQIFFLQIFYSHSILSIGILAVKSAQFTIRSTKNIEIFCSLLLCFSLLGL